MTMSLDRWISLHPSASSNSRVSNSAYSLSLSCAWAHRTSLGQSARRLVVTRLLILAGVVLAEDSVNLLHKRVRRGFLRLREQPLQQAVELRDHLPLVVRELVSSRDLPRSGRRLADQELLNLLS